MANPGYHFKTRNFPKRWICNDTLALHFGLCLRPVATFETRQKYLSVLMRHIRNFEKYHFKTSPEWLCFSNYQRATMTHYDHYHSNQWRQDQETNSFIHSLTFCSQTELSKLNSPNDQIEPLSHNE